MSQKVMVVGSGAREHVLAKAYRDSSNVDDIIVAPGNDFIANQVEGIITDEDCSLKNAEYFLRVAEKYRPDLVDVAQDDALAAGTVNLLRENGFRVFGPTKEAARIEWDKAWSRRFMEKHGIPAPHFRCFKYEENARDYAESIYTESIGKDSWPVLYIKAAGLCGGKGALKATNLHEAIKAIEKMKDFGKAGEVFLIEEGMEGEEFSTYAITDGMSYYIFNSAQDNKRVFDSDKGDQTGGMGAISPAMVTKPIAHKIEKELVVKAINGMRIEGIPYKGILYVGGIDVNGQPINIEYNSRWGDPEVQAVLPSVETDYAEIVLACLDGKLGEINIEQDDKTRICVVGASRGYPGDYSDVKGKQIYGLNEAIEMNGVTVYGAGIKVDDGKFYAAGGRLFSIVAEGKDIAEAIELAYSAMKHVSVDEYNLHFRTDIGWRDVERFSYSD